MAAVKTDGHLAPRFGSRMRFSTNRGVNTPTSAPLGLRPNVSRRVHQHIGVVDRSHMSTTARYGQLEKQSVLHCALGDRCGPPTRPVSVTQSLTFRDADSILRRRLSVVPGDDPASRLAEDT